MFSGLSFSLEPGQALVVTGANGAGKSSLLTILSGRLKPAAGSVSVAREAGSWETGSWGAGAREGAVRADERTLPELVGFVGHREGLKAMLTAEENLAFARDVLGGGGLPPVAALEKLDVAHLARLPVAYLSAGQRRRVALARLFVADRPIWLLDEPTSALDDASTGLLSRLMNAHLAGGGLIVAATHQPLAVEGARALRIAAPGGTHGEAEDDGDAW